MEYQDEISAFLDAENSITARWVANNLRTNLTKARNLLSLYKKAQPELSVSYLVAGINISGSVSYIVSDDVDLEGVRGQFSSIRSEEVYALHKRTSISNKAEIQALECDQASELLFMTHPNSADFYKNSIGCIVCPNVDIKPIGQRILSSKLTVSSQSVPEVRESIKTSINKTLPSAPAASVIKSKSSIQATNFFGAAVAKELKPAKDASAVQEEKPVVAGRSSAAILNSNETPDNASASAVVGAVVAAPAPASAKKVGKIVCDDDEDEEWDSGYKPDAARLKERVDAIAASSSNRISVGSVVDVADMDMTAEDEDGLEGAEGAGAGKTARKKGKHAVVKHGAMDDYMEDIAIAAHNKAEATPADAPKPKKRKLVEKMFADEKGYLVTEMVWEEVTDDEGDTTTGTCTSLSSSYQPAKRPKPTAAAGTGAGATNKETGDSTAAASNKESKKAAAGPAAKASKKAEPAKAQKSMMSFFGKKS